MQEKKRWIFVSSLLKQLWHLDAMDQPLDIAQDSVGVFLWRIRQERQARRGLKHLHQIKPAQGTRAALDLRRFHVSLRERAPVELLCQDRRSGAVVSPISIRLVDRWRYSLSSAESWSVFCQELFWIISAIESLSENCRWGNLIAMRSWSIHWSNHKLIERPFPSVHLLLR